MPLNIEKIKTLRAARGLSYAAAAAAGKLGDRMRWYEVESGRVADPRISTVEKIADALGVKVGTLLSP